MNDEKSLEARIEKAVRSSLIVKKSTRELVKETLSFPNLNSFFNQFSKSPIHKRLLFLHRFDLFGIEDEMQIPYLRLCNLPKIKSKESSESESTALTHIVSNELEVISNYKNNILEQMFGINDSNRDTVSEDFKDIVAYFAIQFIRTNPNIKTLINADQFDYNIMKNVLKNYEGTIELDAFHEEIGAGFEEGKGEIDPIIKSKIEKLILLSVSGLTKNIEKVIDNTSKMLPNIILPFHLSSSLLLNNWHQFLLWHNYHLH